MADAAGRSGIERRLLTGRIVAAEPVHPLLVCSTPPEYSDAVDVLTIANEEDAAVWLWAEPALLGWRRPVEWLFSPVNGNSGWHLGDLWGVDADGELLLIESKLLAGGRRNDPFVDFLNDATLRAEWQADEILGRWRKLYDLEVSSRSRCDDRSRLGRAFCPILCNANVSLDGPI